MANCCDNSKTKSNSNSVETKTVIRTKSSSGTDEVNFDKKHAKIVILGDMSVGKSCMVLRYKGNAFGEQQATVGAAFMTNLHTMKDGKTIKFDVWDTAGAERFHAVIPMYYRGSLGAILAYDITSKQSFKKLRVWLDELHKQAAPNISIIVVGCKSDLAEERDVDCEEATRFATENGCKFIECSAKTGENVREAFELLANLIYEKHKPSQ